MVGKWILLQYLNNNDTSEQSDNCLYFHCKILSFSLTHKSLGVLESLAWSENRYAGATKTHLCSLIVTITALSQSMLAMSTSYTYAYAQGQYL